VRAIDSLTTATGTLAIVSDGVNQSSIAPPMQ
jgi:hypothetical protein